MGVVAVVVKPASKCLDNVKFRGLRHCERLRRARLLRNLLPLPRASRTRWGVRVPEKASGIFEDADLERFSGNASGAT